jgi:hypothetical protein
MKILKAGRFTTMREVNEADFAYFVIKHRCVFVLNDATPAGHGPKGRSEVAARIRELRRGSK